MTEKQIICILIDEIDEDILSRMPSWFRMLREHYQKMFKV